MCWLTYEDLNTTAGHVVQNHEPWPRTQSDINGSIMYTLWYTIYPAWAGKTPRVAWKEDAQFPQQPHVEITSIEILAKGHWALSMDKILRCFSVHSILDLLTHRKYCWTVNGLNEASYVRSLSQTNTRNRDAIKMNMDSLSTVTHVSNVTCNQYSRPTRHIT